MRKYTQLVFDDFIMGAGTIAYTRPELNDMLGQYDQVALHAVTDQCTTVSGTLAVRIQHSADQLNWKDKTGSDDIALANSTAATNSGTGSDAGATVSLGFVRMKLTLNTTTIAHVKLWITARDGT